MLELVSHILIVCHTDFYLHICEPESSVWQVIHFELRLDVQQEDVIGKRLIHPTVEGGRFDCACAQYCYTRGT